MLFPVELRRQASQQTSASEGRGHDPHSPFGEPPVFETGAIPTDGVTFPGVTGGTRTRVPAFTARCSEPLSYGHIRRDGIRTRDRQTESLAISRLICAPHRGRARTRSPTDSDRIRTGSLRDENPMIWPIDLRGRKTQNAGRPIRTARRWHSSLCVDHLAHRHLRTVPAGLLLLMATKAR